MFNRWRTEIERGRAEAEAFGERMQLLVWQLVKVSFVVGVVIGMVLTGGILWLTK